MYDISIIYIYIYGGFLKWRYPQLSFISMGFSEINHPASDQGTQGTPMTWEPLLYIYIYWNICWNNMFQYVTYIGILEQYWSILLEYIGISKGNR